MVILSSFFRKLGLRGENLFRHRQSRWIISSIYDPPLDTKVKEKPFTLLLLEDEFIYNDSWRDSFEKYIPRDYGMAFGSLSFADKSTFHDMVEGTKLDLFNIPDALLISRGPISSWCAQFYLESQPLKGLIMVDPILFDLEEDPITSDAIRKLQTNVLVGAKLLEHNTRLTNLVKESQQRSLKLEPSSVPMFVISSCSELRSASKNVKNRHSDQDGPFGEVAFKEITDCENHDNVMKALDTWIDSIH